MYAVVQSGGKQHRVSPGDVIKVERLLGKSGDKVQLASVLLINDGKQTQVGQPFLDKAKVGATILEQKRDKKIIVFKKKRRQGYRRKHGHRQLLTVLKITDIQGEGISAKAPSKPAVKTTAVQKAEVTTAPKKVAPKATAAKAPTTKTAEAPAATKKAAPTKEATTKAVETKKPTTKAPPKGSEPKVKS